MCQLQYVGVQVLPGSQLLASADEQGNIAVKDLRMLGGSSQQPPRGRPHKGLPPPTSPPSAGLGAGSWGAYSGNAAARGLVWEVRGAHQGQGVVRMITGLRPLADGSTGGSSAHYPSSLPASNALLHRGSFLSGSSAVHNCCMLCTFFLIFWGKVSQKLRKRPSRCSTEAAGRSPAERSNLSHHGHEDVLTSWANVQASVRFTL